MVANLRKMLCFQQNQEWYATLNPCHAQSDRWNLLLSPGARIWIVCVSVFQGALQALSHICMDFVHTCEAPLVSDRKANAFILILILFSIIACKANPPLRDDLSFWSISLLVSPIYVVSVGWWCWWWGSQAQWGRKQCPLTPSYQWRIWLILAAGLTWWCSGLLRNEPTWASSVARLGIRKHLAEVTPFCRLRGHVIPSRCAASPVLASQTRSSSSSTFQSSPLAVSWIISCREPAWGIPPVAKVMRKRPARAKVRSGLRGPPGLSQASTPKAESVCLTALCLSPTFLTLIGGYPPPPFSEKS